jgi:hypothetical protein
MKTSAAIALLLAALLGAPAADAQELGRLFFTPEQRAALDARRKARTPDKPAAVERVESSVTRIDGTVRRSGGKSTVWVNSEAIPEGSPSDAARVAPGTGRVTVPARDGERRQDLRVGESLNRGSGEVRDVIGDGEIRIGPRPAPKKK